MGNQFATRFMVSTSTGGLQMYRTTGGPKTLLDWTREEGLANVQVAEYVEIPESQVLESGGADTEHFGDRLIRQIIEAKVCLHSNIGQHLPTRFCLGLPTICN